STPAASATSFTAAAASTGSRRGDRRFGRFGIHTLGDQLERHQVWFQRAGGAGSAAAGLESPFSQTAGDIQSGGIETTRGKIAAFHGIGSQEIEINFELLLSDRVGVAEG